MYSLSVEPPFSSRSRAGLPIQRPSRTTEPTQAQEPITLDEAKKQCEIATDVSYHDEHINRLIAAARQQVEHDTGLVCCSGAYTWKFTQFPCGEYFELPDVRPVTSITSIQYVDTAGTTQTWSSSNYVLESGAVKPFVRLSYGQTWPTIRGDINGVTVTLVAGYATVLTVPQRVKQAVLYLVNHWFVNRDTVSAGTISPDVSLTYDALIQGLMRSSYP